MSMTPSELQSAGEVQQTTGLGFEHAAISGPAATSMMNMNSRMRTDCRSVRSGVNESLENVLT